MNPSISTRSASSVVTLAAIGLLVTSAIGQSLESSAQASLRRLPSVFVENRGQWDGDFVYKVQTGPMAVFLDQGGWSFTLVDGAKGANGRGVAVAMRFVNGGRAEQIEPEQRSPGVHHYFLGADPGRWATNIPLWESVKLARAWPGVDVRCRVLDRHFEYDVLAGPGADLGQVVVEVTGA